MNVLTYDEILTSLEKIKGITALVQGQFTEEHDKIRDDLIFYALESVSDEIGRTKALLTEIWESSKTDKPLNG